jgi:hypothetical protein
MSAPDTYFAGEAECVQAFAGLPEHLQPFGLPLAVSVRASVERGDPFAARAFPAMLGGSLTSEPEGWSTAAGRPARAHEAVADDAHRPDAQLGVIAADADGDDPAGMEHARQSRLSRWQRLPG